MAYKDILVFLDPTAEAVERIRSAISLARTYESRLIGVDVSAPPAGKEAESEATVTRMFHDATREAAPAAIFVPAEKPGEGDFFTHCVDLMIAPGPESLAHDAIRRGVLDRALLESGAPMLILPPDWEDGPLGENIVIAWNGGREALRGVHDAMPLLEAREEGHRFRLLVAAELLAQVSPDAGRSPGGARRQGRAYLGLDQHRRSDRDRGAVRQPRHAGRRSHRRRRIRSFQALRRAVRRGEHRSLASAIPAGADVALA